MIKPFHYWIALVLAGACLALVALNAGLYFSNQSMQARMMGRAQYIQQSQQIGALYQDIAKMLADLAMERDDQAVNALLAAEGFKINAAPVHDGASNTKGKP